MAPTDLIGRDSADPRVEEWKDQGGLRLRRRQCPCGQCALAESRELGVSAIARSTDRRPHIGAPTGSPGGGQLSLICSCVAPSRSRDAIRCTGFRVWRKKGAHRRQRPDSSWGAWQNESSHACGNESGSWVSAWRSAVLIAHVLPRPTSLLLGCFSANPVVAVSMTRQRAMK